MTNEELNEIEDAIKKAVVAPWVNVAGGCPHYIIRARPSNLLNVITELKQIEKERDWLIENLTNTICTIGSSEYCLSHECEDCKYVNPEYWLKAAKEATK